VSSESLVASRDWLADTLVKKLASWSDAAFHSDDGLRKQQSLSLLDIETYTAVYNKLKKKYGPYFVEVCSLVSY